MNHNASESASPRNATPLETIEEVYRGKLYTALDEVDVTQASRVIARRLFGRSSFSIERDVIECAIAQAMFDSFDATAEVAE